MSICFNDWGGGGDRCPMRGSEATERGRVLEGGYPRPTVGTFVLLLEYQNRILEHFKRFSRDLNVVKFHDEQLELFIEYRLKTIHSLS